MFIRNDPTNICLMGSGIGKVKNQNSRPWEWRSEHHETKFTGINYSGLSFWYFQHYFSVCNFDPKCCVYKVYACKSWQMTLKIYRKESLLVIGKDLGRRYLIWSNKMRMSMKWENIDKFKSYISTLSVTWDKMMSLKRMPPT